MKIIRINPNDILDWESFHFWFQELVGFPNYYGENMDAWVDCMDEFINEPTVIDFGNCKVLKQRNPEIIEAILECSAFVNYRKLERSESAVILVSMFT